MLVPAALEVLVQEGRCSGEASWPWATPALLASGEGPGEPARYGAFVMKSKQQSNEQQSNEQQSNEKDNSVPIAKRIGPNSSLRVVGIWKNRIQRPLGVQPIRIVIQIVILISLLIVINVIKDRLVEDKGHATM